DARNECCMSHEFGVQPLDAILDKSSLKNDDLVQASQEQLTHKQVQKARKGRSITPNIKGKIMRALNAAVDKKYIEKNLFNY
ncbi:MAG TPA: hypothetical protein VI522_07770, partial [Gammaproteobacteria bacterium]|nr:hypothetical protein [Gammaproteobacteria bacterium]